MSKLIPNPFIDDLLSRAEIADVIGSRIKLRRAGTNLIGLCPFHAEKTPSFTVSPNKQFFHCFGCGTHGNAIGFIMKYEQLSFVAAVENLATQYGLTVPQETVNSQAKTYLIELYQLTEKVTAFFEQQLGKSKLAINYLKSRGLTGEICKKFRVGYAPNAWESLNYIFHNSPKTKQNLIAAGILVSKNNQTYTRFRERIMFPIRNSRGQIIGFGGRTLNHDPAKYLNSPETPIFHKGEELYGLYEARQQLRNLTSIIVVEGYLDVIALAQFGIHNVVATLGTAISSKQIRLLLRNSDEIIFCFDGDQAGRSAAWRALESSLLVMRAEIQIKFLFLPDGEDPDSLIRKEQADKFKERLITALPISEFCLEQLTAKLNLNTIDEKAKLVKNSQALLQKMPNGIFRQLLTSKIATLANINVAELEQQLSKEQTFIKVKENTKEEQVVYDIKPPLPIQIKNAINILLHHPQIALELSELDNLKNIKIQGIEILFNLISLIKKHPKISLGVILEKLREQPESKLLNDLASKEPIIPQEVLKNELTGIIRSLIDFADEQTIKEIMAKATTKELSSSEKQQLQSLIIMTKNRLTT